MDDPWKNAWVDPTKDTATESKVTSDLSWPATTANDGKFGAVHDDSEADLSLPSWSTGAWGDSGNEAGSLWGTTDTTPDAGWGASTYEDISFSAPPKLSALDNHNDLPVPTIQTDPFPSSPARSETPIPEPEPLSIPSPLESASPVPGSPDGFGTFEEGQTDQTIEPWTSSLAGELGTAEADGGWGTAWNDARTEESGNNPHDDGPVDEWKAAQIEQERRDKLVPPEVRIAILSKAREAAKEIWPLPDPYPSDELERYRSFEDIDGFTNLKSRIAPSEPPLHPPVLFWKSHTAKEMHTALKLTRNVPLTRTSPLAHFASSRGSSTWEAAVRARKVAQSDDVPVGWRIVEKAPEPVAVDAAASSKAKASGWSFWGRRASGVPSEVTPSPTAVSREDSSSPRPASPRTSITSPRASIDARKANASTSSLSSLSSASAPAVVVLPVIAPTPPVATGPDFFSPADDPMPVPAPSAVSRFLSRFSRTRSGGAERHSLALSTDDLEFLSDIAPNDAKSGFTSLGTSGGNVEIAGLEAMIKSEPILGGKLPAPLPPPPKITPPARRPMSYAGRSGTSSMQSALGESLSPTLVPLQTALPISQSSSVASAAESAVSSVSSGTDGLSFNLASLGSFDSALLPNQSASPSVFVSAGVRQFAPSPKLIIPSLSSASTSSNEGVPVLAPPPRQSTLSPTSIMPARSFVIDDDDDNTPLAVLHSPARKAPPPFPLPTTQAQLQATTTSDDDDDFDNFQDAGQSNFVSFGSDDPFGALTSIQSAPTLGSSSTSDAFSTSSSQPFNTMTPNKSHIRKAPRPTFALDDFDDFTSAPSPLRSPSPPRPPSKTPSMLQLASARRAGADHTVAGQSAVPSALENLVLDAAARTGQWPAPPSPLPPALRPPPSVPQASSQVTQTSDSLFGESTPPATVTPAVVPPIVNTPIQPIAITPQHTSTSSTTTSTSEAHDDFDDFFNDWNAKATSAPTQVAHTRTSLQMTSINNSNPVHASSANPSVVSNPRSSLPSALPSLTGPGARSTRVSASTMALPPPPSLGGGIPVARMSRVQTPSASAVAPLLPPPPGGVSLPSRPSSRAQASATTGLAASRVGTPLTGATGSGGTHSRSPSKVDHLPTLNLLNMANARGGAWPAPRSPLPAALSPPPEDIPILRPPAGQREREADILDLGLDAPVPVPVPEPLKTESAARATRTLSPPLLSPPPLGIGMQPLQSNILGGEMSAQMQHTRSQSSASLGGPNQANGFSAMTTSMQHMRTQSTTSQASQGGLSSADLSFFEGL